MPLSAPVDITQRLLDRLPEQFKGKPRIEALARSYGAELQTFADAQWLLYQNRQLQKGPAQIIGRALFSNTDTATAYWPQPFADTSYLTLLGRPVITDGGGPVVVAIDNTTKTKSSIAVKASAPFGGYCNILAWNIGENPLARGIGGDLLDKIGKIVGEPRDARTDSEYWVLVTAKIAANKSDGKRETLIRIAKLLVPGASIYVKDFPPCSVLIYPQAPIQIDPYVAASFLEIAKAAGVYLMFGWTSTSLASTLTLGYSVANGTTVPTTAQSPGWSGTGSNAIAGGALAGIVAG